MANETRGGRRGAGDVAPYGETRLFPVPVVGDGIAVPRSSRVPRRAGIARPYGTGARGVVQV